MIHRQLLDGHPALDDGRDEFTGSVSRPRDHGRGGTVKIVGACSGPDEAGAFGPGRRAPA